MIPGIGLGDHNSGGKSVQAQEDLSVHKGDMTALKSDLKDFQDTAVFSGRNMNLPHH